MFVSISDKCTASTNITGKRDNEALINRLYGRIAALRCARNLDYPDDMSRFLRSVRPALHPAQTINQSSHNGIVRVKRNNKRRKQQNPFLL